jgi:hypothetical protein
MGGHRCAVPVAAMLRRRGNAEDRDVSAGLVPNTRRDRLPFNAAEVDGQPVEAKHLRRVQRLQEVVRRLETSARHLCGIDKTLLVLDADDLKSGDFDVGKLIGRRCHSGQGLALRQSKPCCFLLCGGMPRAAHLHTERNTVLLDLADRVSNSRTGLRLHQDAVEDAERNRGEEQSHVAGSTLEARSFDNGVEALEGRGKRSVKSVCRRQLVQSTRTLGTPVRSQGCSPVLRPSVPPAGFELPLFDPQKRSELGLVGLHLLDGTLRILAANVDLERVTKGEQTTPSRRRCNVE